jgi:uncharacterized protein YdaU (DUF1376 family)
MKSPAFQFYPDDFLGSPNVRAMTTLEIGIYLLLLCLDWNGDGFLYDEEELARSCRVSRAVFRKAWTRISRCFQPDPQGRYRNARLQREREKQREYSERMSANGKKGGRPKRQAADKPRLSGEKAAVKPNESIPFPSPTPIPKTKPSAARVPRKRESWLLPISAVYEAQKGKGSFPWGEAGSHLKAIHDGGATADEIAANLGRCFVAGKFFSLANFAKNYADFSATHDRLKHLDGYPDILRDGWFTEYGEAVTRPDGMTRNPYLA